MTKELTITDTLRGNISLIEKSEFPFPIEGVQYVFDCGNGYGASVIKSKMSYGGKNGLWELAMIKFNSEHRWDLYYHDIVNNDVLGYLEEKEVMGILEKIAKLK